MGDEEIGQLPLVLQVAEQVDHLRLGRHVERADGLVADQQARIEGERPGHGDALSLAAAELVGIAAERGPSQPDRLEQLDHPRVTGRAPQPEVHLQRLADRLHHRRPGVERRVGVLEHDLHAARPPVGSISRSTRRAVVDLPDPLSPTSPNVRPRSIVKLMPSTARTCPIVRRRIPLCTGNSIRRSLTSSSGATSVKDCGGRADGCAGADGSTATQVLPVRLSSSARRQRLTAPSGAAVNGGSVVEQYGWTCGQRGWKRQPDGNRSGNGTCPGMTRNRVPAGAKVVTP